MRTLRINYQKVPALPPSVCAIGYFDGLHKGHQKLIDTAVCEAGKQGICSAVLTFDPDPWAVVKPDARLTHLTDLADKERLLEAMGVDLFYIVDFSKSFASLSADEFHAFLNSLQIRKLVCGFDFSYAYRGSGNVQSLKAQNCFEVEVISSVDLDDQKISSTRLEKLLASGDVALAGELCGFYYSLKGEIVHGYKRGRQLGFPTANLQTSKEAIVPAAGVYSGYVQSGTLVCPAMINIGNNPTFDNTRSTVEAYLLGVHINLYGKKARFFLVAKLRPEVRFESVEALRRQLEKDEQAVIPSLRAHSALLERTAKLWSLDGLDAILRTEKVR